MMSGNGEQERAIGLAELAGMIEGVISGSFDRGYWVRAEMARLNLYPESGHCYPDLVEKEGRTVKAQMRGTIWAGNYQRIARQFLEVAREPLRDGLQILCFATVRFHPQYGLSLQISDIDPTYTLGQMARERLETIHRLREEGLFDANRMLDFPALPKRLAIISVSTSKGYSDFINILQNYRGKYHFLVRLFPALLQGDKAVDSIMGQFRAIRKQASAFDAVAIIRGGGGDVGLSCYDDYRLAREVATFPLPVITGIGHSTNQTVVEMVASRNQITPTDVAYFLLSHFEAFSARLEEIYRIISGHAESLIAEKNLRINEWAVKIGKRSGRELETQQIRLNHLARESTIRIRQVLHSEKNRIDISTGKIRVMDPINTLKRGFSITYLHDKALKDAHDASSGDIVKTILYHGEIISKITSKEE